VDRRRPSIEERRLKTFTSSQFEPSDEDEEKQAEQNGSQRSLKAMGKVRKGKTEHKDARQNIKFSLELWCSRLFIEHS